MVEHNADVAFANVRDRGFIVLDITANANRADYMAVSAVRSQTYEAIPVTTVSTGFGPDGRLISLIADAGGNSER